MSADDFPIRDGPYLRPRDAAAGVARRAEGDLISRDNPSNLIRSRTGD